MLMLTDIYVNVNRCDVKWLNNPTAIALNISNHRQLNRITHLYQLFGWAPYVTYQMFLNDIAPTFSKIIVIYYNEFKCRRSQILHLLY